MTIAPLTRAEKVDAATPESRNRVVDFLRAATIIVVVLGQWAIIAVGADGGILPHGVFDGAAWSHPLTWKFQVTPVPTWFLTAYLVVILVAPPCLVLWERFDWWSIIGGIALAGAVDALTIAADQPLLGYSNYLRV